MLSGMRQALALDPSDPVVHSNRSLCHLRLKNHAEASSWMPVKPCRSLAGKKCCLVAAVWLLLQLICPLCQCYAVGCWSQSSLKVLSYVYCQVRSPEARWARRRRGTRCRRCAATCCAQRAGRVPVMRWARWAAGSSRVCRMNRHKVAQPGPGCQAVSHANTPELPGWLES